MQLPIILKALRRHKITVAILLLEFAITFALLSNAGILVWQRFSALRTISGVQEQGLLVAKVTATTPGAALPTADKLSSVTGAIGRIRGVRAVSIMSQTPFSGVDSLQGRVSRTPGAGSAAHEMSVYYGDRKMHAVLESHLVAGRWFNADEYSHPATMPSAAELHLIILTRHLANKLFPQEDPLGKTIYSRERPMVIIGITWSCITLYGRPILGAAAFDHDDAAIYPVVPRRSCQRQSPIRLDAAMSDEVPVGKSIENRCSTRTFKGGAIPGKSPTTFKQQPAMFTSPATEVPFGWQKLLFCWPLSSAVAINAVAGLSFLLGSISAPRMLSTLDELSAPCASRSDR